MALNTTQIGINQVFGNSPADVIRAAQAVEDIDYDRGRMIYRYLGRKKDCIENILDRRRAFSIYGLMI